MSTPATAPARTGDMGPGGKQFHMLPNQIQDEPTDSAQSVSTEVARVERLITQLEARSMALVPYGYGALREVPQKSNTPLIAAGLIAVWISTMALGIAYMRYTSRASVAAERAQVAPLVIPAANDPQEQQVARSVDHLAKALVSSSERLNQLQAEMERSNKDLQRIAVKVNANGDRPKTAAGTTSRPAEVSMSAPPTGAASALPANSPLPKNWHQVIDIKPSDAAVPHQSAEGNIDYWLVPRGGDKSQMSKVLPIGRNAEGVVIHNLEDGKDYTLTATGEWKNGALGETSR